MRILYLQMFPLYGSGSGTYSRELAQEIAKTNKVAIVVPDKRKIKNVKNYYVDLPLKIAYGLNFIVTVHGSELPTLENDKRYPYLTTEALLKAKSIVPNSFWTKEWMQKVLGNQF